MLFPPFYFRAVSVGCDNRWDNLVVIFGNSFRRDRFLDRWKDRENEMKERASWHTKDEPPAPGDYPFTASNQSATCIFLLADFIFAPQLKLCQEIGNI